MLKGKKGLYILLPVVAFIWGAIIYQVVDAFSEDEPVVSDAISVSFAKIETREREKFTLGTIHRDPFLGTVYKPKKNVPITRQPIKNKVEIIWPSISYKGMVSDANAATAIFLVAINGTDQLMKRNDVIADVKLLRGTKNMVKLRYKGKTKQFEISN